MSSVQFIALLAGAFFFGQVLLLAARRRLRDRHAFFWVLLSLLAVGVAVALPFFDSLAVRLGIAYMPTLVFMAGFYLILSILMYHTTVLSHQQDGLKVLAQEIAYLRRELHETSQAAARGSQPPPDDMGQPAAATGQESGPAGHAAEAETVATAGLQTATGHPATAGRKAAGS